MTDWPSKFQAQFERTADPERPITISHTTNGYQWYSWRFTEQDFATFMLELQTFAHSPDETRRRVRVRLDASSDHAGTPRATGD